jgi:transposase-like protein
MTINNRVKQCEKMLYAGMKNLFQSQDVMSLNEFSVIILEILMLLEREEYLKSAEGKEDIGNGTYKRSFSALHPNKMLINIPRTRNGEFKPLTIEILKKNQESVNDLALLLYRKGLSSRDVSEIMKDFFGEKMSYETVNNLAESFHAIREKWENQMLDAYYKVIYCDALYVNLKRNNSYTKEAVHVIFGVKEDNTRELLLLEVNPTESCHVWKEHFQKLQARGVEQVDLIVADGLKGLGDTAKASFQGAAFQCCVAHKMRSVLNKVRPRDKQAVAQDLKEVFNNFESTSTSEAAYSKLSSFRERWGKVYPKIEKSLTAEEFVDYFTYISCPVEVRRMVYTTNAIENLNRQIRKVTKTKVTFDKEENLLDLVFMIIKDFEGNNWQKYPVYAFKNFKKTQSN